jgi:hypothetical protein
MVVLGRQESHQVDHDRSSACGAPDDIHASTLVGIVSCECEQPCRGPTSKAQEEPAPVMLGADGTSLGTASVEVDATADPPWIDGTFV